MQNLYIFGAPSFSHFAVATSSTPNMDNFINEQSNQPTGSNLDEAME